MRKNIVCAVLTVVLLALCVSVNAQQQKVAKIGWLGTGFGSGPASGPEVIRRELSKLGYVEGKNIAFEHRYYSRKPFPSCPASLCYGRLDNLNTRGKKANLQRENWVFTLIPWR